MIEILAMLGGGLLRLMPFFVDFFKGKRDADHEFRMAGLQLQIDQQRASQQIDLVHAQGSVLANQGEMTALAEALRSQAAPTGYKWVDWLSATVRPILTYFWCVTLYGSAKIVQVVVAFQTNAKLEQFIPILVTEFDRSVIGSILAFWFVDRALSKGGK